MNFIVEYIGKTGVVTSPLNYRRWQTPRPGDPVCFSLLKGKYPFSHEWGTIEQIGTGFCKPDEAHLCAHHGSIYLSCENSVSISGGPFETVKLSRLIPMFTVRQQRMWNWGDHSPGAHQGVEYIIERPAFQLMPE